MVTIRWCAACAVDTEFERFDCTDHGPECLELVCTGCGLGLELAPVRRPEPAPRRVSTAA